MMSLTCARSDGSQLAEQRREIALSSSFSESESNGWPPHMCLLSGTVPSSKSMVSLGSFRGGHPPAGGARLRWGSSQMQFFGCTTTTGEKLKCSSLQ
jgi:hypothetical protein